MDAFQVEVMARFSALEHVVCQIGKLACIAARLGPEAVKAMADHEKKKREEETFPGAGPAMSDHLAAEIGENVNRLLSAIAADVAAAYRSAQKQG